MKHILLALIIFTSVYTKAEIRSLKEIIEKASPAEKKDFATLLAGITVIPTHDPTIKNSLLKVVRVQKGSVYDREGLKVGDLVSQ
jgi:hypothetical protein